MGTFRTAETDAKYVKYRAEGGLEGGCRLCEAPSIMQFKHWRVIDNAFPYDKIASLHHMLVPVRHVPETEITSEMREELRELKESALNKEYEFIMEALPKMKSIPGHFHLHLLVPISDLHCSS